MNDSRGYPVEMKQRWSVAIEFADGNRVVGVDDQDVLDRWRALAAWWDPSAATDPDDWMRRILGRAGALATSHAPLLGVTERSPSSVILDALFDAGVLIGLQRK